MGKAKDFKFGTLVAHISHGMTSCPSNGHNDGHVTNYEFWGPQS